MPAICDCLLCQRLRALHVTGIAWIIIIFTTIIITSTIVMSMIITIIITAVMVSFYYCYYYGGSCDTLGSSCWNHGPPTRVPASPLSSGLCKTVP